MRVVDLLHRWAGGTIGVVLALLGLSGTILLWKDSWIGVRHAGDAHRLSSVGGDDTEDRTGDTIRGDRGRGGGEGGVGNRVDHGCSSIRGTIRDSAGTKTIAARLSTPDSRKKPS